MYIKVQNLGLFEFKKIIHSLRLKKISKTEKKNPVKNIM